MYYKRLSLWGNIKEMSKILALLALSAVNPPERRIHCTKGQ